MKFKLQSQHIDVTTNSTPIANFVVTFSFNEVILTNAKKHVVILYLILKICTLLGNNCIKIKIVIKNICKEYGINNTDTLEIIGLFDYNDYKLDIANNDIMAIQEKITNKIISHAPNFILNKITQNYPYVGATINYLLKWLN